MAWNGVRSPLFRFAAATLFSAVAMVGTPSFSWAESPSERYLDARNNYPPRLGLTLDVVAKNPDAYKGATVELTGRLMGLARSDEGASLMLATEGYGSLVLQMSRVPDWVQSGDRLRVLAVIGGGKEPGTTIGLPDLLIVAVASASDIQAMEARWQEDKKYREARNKQNSAALKAAAARLARSPLPSNKPGRTTLASRGAGARGSVASGGLSSDSMSVYQQYRAYIRAQRSKLTEQQVDSITTAILAYSERFDVDPRLVIALIMAESSFNPSTTSHKGAMGLGQLMPDEVKTLGLTNPYDPVQNVAGSIYLLRGRLDKYSGGAAREDLTMRQIILALASYNAGMGAVK